MRKIGSKFLILVSCLTICLTIFSSKSEAETLEPTYEVYEYTAEDLAEEEYWDSLEYLAQCVEAEAGNQGYLGKVYVADCILNLYDAGDYNNFYELIIKLNIARIISAVSSYHKHHLGNCFTINLCCNSLPITI